MRGRDVPLQDLLDWIKAEPFAPFRLRLTNGQAYDIHAPSMIWPGRQSVLIGFPNPDDRFVYDKHVTVGLLHIASIEPLGSPTAA
jgi:hypothetical protein